MTEVLAPYAHAIASLSLWALIMVVLSMLSVKGRTDAHRCDCGQPKRDYDDPVYRRGRAFANAIETSGPFIAATVAAILSGAPAFWVNLLASVFVVARIAMAVVHIRTTNQPARSAFFAVGLFCVIFLGVMAFVAALQA